MTNTNTEDIFHMMPLYMGLTCKDIIYDIFNADKLIKANKREELIDLLSRTSEVIGSWTKIF